MLILLSDWLIRLEQQCFGTDMVYYISKSKNLQFANFGKYPILSPDLAMENDIV
jgi:hypothetical protein